MTPIDEQKALETVVAAMKRWEQAPRVDLLLKPYEGWIVISGLQLCLRHPELPPAVREILTRVGRRLQPLVCDTAELDDIAERGWDTAYDVPSRHAPDPTVQQHPEDSR